MYHFDFFRLLRSWLRYRVRRFAFAGFDLIAPALVFLLILFLVCRK